MPTPLKLGFLATRRILAAIRPPLRSLAVLVGIGLLTLACGDQAESALSPLEDLSPHRTAADRQAFVRPGERAFAKLAEAVPGFAGYYFDDSGGETVVRH